jgi:outer membrane biosynthesis protein TonB
MDMSPYEEEYAFDPYAQVAAPSPRQQFAPAQNAAYVAQAQPAPQPAPEQQPEPEPQRYVEPVVQSAPVAEDPPAREPQIVAQPTPEPEPEPAQPETEPEPVSQAASAPAVETPAPKKAATKRASRTTGGVPNDILNMMTAIFGEGITYTSEPSVEEQVDVIDDDVTAGDDFSDATSDGGEFLEEPVDDADYDEE